MLQNIKWKQAVLNILVTFVEGFLAAWLVTDHATSKVALIGAGAAGLSSAWNLVIKPLLKSQGAM